MTRKILIGIAVIAVLAFIGYKILYKPHRNINSEKAAFALTAVELQTQFVKDPAAANTKYADKTIGVSGVVTDVDSASHSVIIDSKLSAILQSPINFPKPGQHVSLKGRLVGYDDLLEELKMDQVTLNAPNNE